MAYSDFTLESVIDQFQLSEQRVQLFSGLVPLTVSSWLTETLDYSLDLGLVSSNEKARSEFIVAPILLEMERRNNRSFAIYSGKSLDVDRSLGLTGECDFMLSKGQLSKTIQSPILALVEAKKQDIDLGLGQCTAQMLGAQLFNQQKNNAIASIYGCVTTGESWQFLKLQDQKLTIDRDIYYIVELGKVLGAFQTILDASP
jgi:hypothetical protein